MARHGRAPAPVGALRHVRTQILAAAADTSVMAQITVGVAASGPLVHGNIESASAVLISPPAGAAKTYLGTDNTVTTATGLLLPNGVATLVPFRGIVGEIWLISDTAAQAVGYQFV